jgi:hypothetical protein
MHAIQAEDRSFPRQASSSLETGVHQPQSLACQARGLALLLPVWSDPSAMLMLPTNGATGEVIKERGLLPIHHHGITHAVSP